LVEAQMTLYASEVFRMLELETQQQFTEALEKALHAMQEAGIPVEHHIQPVYAATGSNLITDYKMTPFATGMLAIHVYPDTPVTARLKSRWVKEGIKGVR